MTKYRIMENGNGRFGIQRFSNKFSMWVWCREERTMYPFVMKFETLKDAQAELNRLEAREKWDKNEKIWRVVK